jgi:predicted metal-dependent phosphoesterase TrpH
MHKADLHIHSCLSPCGSLYNSPDEIVQHAHSAGLDIIALTDHNSALNCPAFLEHCSDRGILGICGMEITTLEEIHLLAYFPDLETAMDFSQYIADLLMKIPNRPEKMGDQVAVNKENEILENYPWYLGAAAQRGISDLVTDLHALGALAIPAHIGRRNFSLLSQLGMIPDLPFDAMEARTSEIAQNYKDWLFLTGSDSHYLETIGNRYTVLGESGETDGDGFALLRNAIKKRRVQPVYSPA